MAPRSWAIRATQKWHDQFSDLWSAPRGSRKAENITVIAALVIPTYLGLAWSRKLRKPFYTLGFAMAFLAASFAVP